MSEPTPLPNTCAKNSNGSTPGGECGPPATLSANVLRPSGVSIPDSHRVELRDPDSCSDAPIVRLNSEEVPVLSEGSRYQFVGEIARGGMGVILKVRDCDIGRDIAVKVMLDTHRDQPELFQRFIEEAQIAGQLQHPGIVPVYELGQFPDSIAKQFESGRTIQRHTAILDRRWPSSTDLTRQ